MTSRKYIKPGTRVPFRLSGRERDVIVQHAFLDPEIEARLRGAATVGAQVAVDLTLDDIDDLVGCVAAEANHTQDRNIRRALDGVFGRLTRLLDRFTDEEAPKPPTTVVGVDAGVLTEKQGQYLAFIFYYTKIHRVPPAEGDLQRFFKVSGPAVHAMILALERRGLIERVAGKARSIRVVVPHQQLPELR
jgi:repressor LexA